MKISEVPTVYICVQSTSEKRDNSLHFLGPVHSDTGSTVYKIRSEVVQTQDNFVISAASIEIDQRNNC